jgi:uncharacterized protein YigA (DUF484 family)
MHETLVEWELKKLHDENLALERRIATLEAEAEARDQAERRQLRSALIFLGSVIVSLLGVIWTYRTIIFTGKQ